MGPYDKKFFQNIEKDSLLSAREIVPFVVDFLKPKSVIDVGCGLGVWLSVFIEHGVENILGVDGDYVDLDSIFIPRRNFYSHDLNQSLKLEKNFDLVVSLEVAEHIQSKFAKDFVKSLTSLGDIVMFSAAIPFQGGTNHVNEQWQEYWERLFNDEGYEAVDLIRKRVWNNPKVSTWFAQNILFYVSRDLIDRNPIIKAEKEKSNFPISVVHPKHYENLVLLNNMGLKRTLRAMPRMILHAILRKIARR
jgi:hypothetical protein